MAVPGAPRKRASYQGDGGSVRRALRLLDAVSRHYPEPAGLRDLAEETGLSHATAFRLLHVLVEEGVLEFRTDVKAYLLGPAIAAIGARQLGRDPVRARAQAAMLELWEATGETVTLSLRQGLERVYVDQLVSRQPVRFEVELGTRHPLYAGGTGRAILAYLPPEGIEACLSQPLLPLAHGTVTDAGRLRELLAEVRAQGYAVSHSERAAGAISVAAPILDAGGQPVAALSVCAPDNRTSVEELAVKAGPLVRERALAISRQLGFVGPSSFYSSQYENSSRK